MRPYAMLCYARYVETTRQIVGAAKAIGKAIEETEGIELVGRADACVVVRPARVEFATSWPRTPSLLTRD